MTSLEWGRLHSVDAKQLDADHAVIADLMTQLSDAVETDQSHEIISNIVAAIREFTDHHLKREAAVLAVMGTAPLPGHYHLHTQAIDAMTDMTARIIAGEWSIVHDLGHIRPILDLHLHLLHAPTGVPLPLHPAVDRTAPIMVE